MASTYTLRIQIGIEEKDERGAWTGGRLGINEEQQIDAESFMEIAAILGKFHAVGEEIKRERTRRDSVETGSQ